MKIRVRYDNQITCIDVPEEAFTLMIQADYDERRAAADDPSTIRPRSPQEIFEERFNRPDYNNWHRHWRHTDDNAIPRRLDHKVGFIGDHPDDAGNHGERSHFDVDAFPDTVGELAAIQSDSYQEQCEMLRQMLKPDYADIPPPVGAIRQGFSIINWKTSLFASSRGYQARGGFFDDREREKNDTGHAGGGQAVQGNIRGAGHRGLCTEGVCA